MTKLLANRHNEIIEKQEILDAAKIQLKKEFIGLDSIIDEVIASISSWYLFPDLQEKPVIVNLWGLTGVGKSALIERLAKLIDYDEKFFHFDLGEKEGGNTSIKDQLESINENLNGYPILIALDEFQHARTIDSIGGEKERYGSRIIWQLLDSGKFQIIRYRYGFGVENIFHLIKRLRIALKNGVKVSKGKVISKQEYFIKHMDLDLEIDPETGKISIRKRPSRKRSNKNTPMIPFVPEDVYDEIFELNKERFESPYKVKLIVEQLSGYETLEFLNEVITYAISPKTVDCSKSLIFVVGNLDEAYTMSHDFNPDIDADEFHEQSLKISVPIVKNALQMRFRSEQIARLGNNHIIYPAFSKESYEKLIKLELTKIADWIFKLQNIQLAFDQSILDLIYKEGVYPTQGTRPLFTTIHQIVNTKLAKVMVEIIVKKLNTSKVLFKATSKGVCVEFIKEDVVLHSIEIPQQFSLEKLRRNKKDDMQAIIAVHEAGHAVLSSILLRTIPEVIFSKSAESTTAGFVYAKFKWKYVSRKEIKSRLAIYLGGFAAEKIVFGVDNVTTGAESDFEEATAFIARMLKTSGMGSFQGAIHSKSENTRFFMHDEDNSFNVEIKSWMDSAMLLAEKTLKEQEVLLLKMADYLSDHRMLRTEEIKTMIANYAYDFDMDSVIENGDLLFYRNHLKNKVLGKEAKVLVPVENRISWNKQQ